MILVVSCFPEVGMPFDICFGPMSSHHWDTLTSVVTLINCWIKHLLEVTISVINIPLDGNWGIGSNEWKAYVVASKCLVFHLTELDAKYRLSNLNLLGT